jgi:hypothetical protein
VPKKAFYENVEEQKDKKMNLDCKYILMVMNNNNNCTGP